MFVVINGKICWSIVTICPKCENLCKITEKNITMEGKRAVYTCLRCKSQLEILKEDMPESVYKNLMQIN